MLPETAGNTQQAVQYFWRKNNDVLSELIYGSTRITHPPLSSFMFYPQQKIFAPYPLIFFIKLD